MKFEVRSRDRRALVILGAAAIVYMIVSFGLLPAFDSLQLQFSSAGDKEQLLSKYRRALVRKGNYANLLDQVRKNIAADEPLFIRGDNPTLAAVDLQGIVEGAAQKMNVELTQRNVSAARKKDDFFNEITMTVSFESTAAQMSGFLAELRNSPKFISIRSAQIAPTDLLHAPPDKGAWRKMSRATLTITAPLPAPPGGNG